MPDIKCKHCGKPIQALEYEGKPDWIHEDRFFSCFVISPFTGLYEVAAPTKHAAQQIYPGRASYEFNEKANKFYVAAGGHGLAEAEDSEVADFICQAWNAAEPASYALKTSHAELLTALESLLAALGGTRNELAEVYVAHRAIANAEEVAHA